jgi:hypothetical protein
MPYTEHPELPRTFAEDTSIWRYFSFAQFLSLLEFRALHFTRADLLPDPFVDLVSQPTLSAFPGMTAKGVRRALEMMRISRQAIFVNCWYASQSGLPDVWAGCGGKNGGIAIRSSVGKLKAALQRSSQKVHISNVTYINYDTDPIPLGNAFLSALHKNKRFQPEREVRALFLWAGGDPTTFCPGPEQGVEVEVDTSSLIEEVQLAPLSDPWFHKLVAAVSKRCLAVG